MAPDYNNGKSGSKRLLSLVGPINMICPARPCLPRSTTLGNTNIKLKVDSDSGGWFTAPKALIPKNKNGEGDIIRYVNCSKEGETYSIYEMDMSSTSQSADTKAKGRKNKEDSEYYECRLGSKNGVALFEDGDYKQIILFERKNDGKELVKKSKKRRKKQNKE